MTSPVTSELAACHACPLCLHRRKVAHPVAPSPFGNRFMAVGTYPTQVDDAAGLAFKDTYRAELLDGCLAYSGLSPEHWYKTYFIKCRPAENNYPEGIEAETCPVWMLYELYVNKPLVVAVFGRRVVEWFRHHFDSAQFGKILMTTHAALQWYNPAIDTLLENGGKVVESPTWAEERMGPMIVPIYDIDEIAVRKKSHDYRKKLQRQLRQLKRATQAAMETPLLWSAALMGGHLPEADDENK